MNNLPLVPALETTIVDVVGDGVTDNTTVISAALSAASTNGGGIVQIPSSTTSTIITSTIEVPHGVTLQIDKGAILEQTSNLHAVEILPGGFVNGGGEIYISNAASTSACLYLDGNAHVFDRLNVMTGASDLLLNNAGIQAVSTLGYGIYMYADNVGAGQINYVNWTSFTDINITNCDRAIYMYCLENTDDNIDAYINGNHFTNIFVDNSSYAIYIDQVGTRTPAIAANHFVNVSYQSGALPEQERAIYCSGTSNHFINFRVWDWIGPDTCIEVPGATNTLMIEGVDVGEFDCQVSNQIRSNILPFGIPRVTDTNLPTGAQWENTIAYVPDRRCLAYNKGGEWEYIGSRREIAKTAGSGIGWTEMGCMFTNEGASTIIKLTLPLSTTIPYQEVMFRRIESFALRIDFAVGDQCIGGSGDAKYISLDTDGGYVHLRNYAPGLWHIVASYGAISYE